MAVVGYARTTITEPSADPQLDMLHEAGRVLAAITDFRHDTVRERTHVGLATARAEGRAGGRPIVMTPDKVTVAAT